MHSATFIPSTAAEIIPPAYPAPSPAGYKPGVLTLSNISAFRVMRNGEDVNLTLDFSDPEEAAVPQA